MKISHVGLRVRDLEASKRFYEALGFTEATRLTIPDEVAGGLLPLTPPIGFEAVYLCNNGFVLQLLNFSGHPAPDEPERTMLVGSASSHRLCDGFSSTKNTPPENVVHLGCQHCFLVGVKRAEGLLVSSGAWQGGSC